MNVNEQDLDPTRQLRTPSRVTFPRFKNEISPLFSARFFQIKNQNVPSALLYPILKKKYHAVAENFEIFDGEKKKPSNPVDFWTLLAPKTADL